MNETIKSILKKCEDKLNARLLEKGVLYADEARELIMSELGAPIPSFPDNTGIKYYKNNKEVSYEH